MSIEPTTRNMHDVLLAVDPGDAQAAVIALALNDAQQTRKQARESRNAAYQDRIDLMQRAADKLRDMAGNALTSAIVQGVAGLAAAGLSTWGSFNDIQAKGWEDAGNAAKARALEGAAAVNRGAAQLAGVGANFAGAQSSNIKREAQKREIETQAEVAAKRSEMEGDRAAEARRMEQSLKRQLEKLLDARQAAMSAAVREG